jgi:hypothetical protein
MDSSDQLTESSKNVNSGSLPPSFFLLAVDSLIKSHHSYSFLVECNKSWVLGPPIGPSHMAALTALLYPTIILLTIHLSMTWYTLLCRIEGLPLSLTTIPTAVPTIPISFRTIHMVARTLHTRFKTLPPPLQPTSRATLCYRNQAYHCTAGLHCPAAHSSPPKEPFHYPLLRRQD